MLKRLTDSDLLTLRAAHLLEQSEACADQAKQLLDASEALRNGSAALVQLVIDAHPDHVIRGGGQ